MSHWADLHTPNSGLSHEISAQKSRWAGPTGPVSSCTCGRHRRREWFSQGGHNKTVMGLVGRVRGLESQERVEWVGVVSLRLNKTHGESFKLPIIVFVDSVSDSNDFSIRMPLLVPLNDVEWCGSGDNGWTKTNSPGQIHSFCFSLSVHWLLNVSKDSFRNDFLKCSNDYKYNLSRTPTSMSKYMSPGGGGEVQENKTDVIIFRWVAILCWAI